MQGEKREIIREERILWIDLFKGLAIILVVLGHATGLLNGYIYQFHVPAFFFISGLVSRFERDSCGQTLVKRVCSIMIPMITAVVCSGIILTVLIKTGTYPLFYDPGTEQGFYQILMSFASNGVTVDWLGAMWFLWVLFWVSVLGRFLFALVKEKKILFGICILAAYLGGYWLLHSAAGERLPFLFRLVPVSLGYFGAGAILGLWMRQSGSWYIWKNSQGMLHIALFILSTAVMYLLKNFIRDKAIMDLASGTINHLPFSTIAVANGILWLYSFSCLLERYGKVFSKWIVAAGKNSLGIMLFHFLFFRLSALILFGLNLVPASACRQLVPQEEAMAYWPVYFALGTIGSGLLWAGIKRIPVLRSMFGQDRKIQDAIFGFSVYEEISGMCKDLMEAVRTGFCGRCPGKRLGRKKA